MFDRPCCVRLVLENTQAMGIFIHLPFFYLPTRCIFDLGAFPFLWIIRRGILCFFVFGQGDATVLHFS
jgi:hypothetical protein